MKRSIAAISLCVAFACSPAVANAALVKLGFSSFNADVVTHGLPVGTPVKAVLTYDSDAENTLVMPFPSVMTYANFPALTFKVDVGGNVYEASGPITISQAAVRGWVGEPSYGSDPGIYDFFLASAAEWRGPTLAQGYSLREFMFQLKIPSYLLNGIDRDAFTLSPDGPRDFTQAYFGGAFKSPTDTYDHLVYGYTGTWTASQVPEPTTTSLIALAFLVASARKRQLLAT
jgi:hypothetical protein